MTRPPADMDRYSAIATAAATGAAAPAALVRPSSAIKDLVSAPQRLLQTYDEFISRNASQVSQIESAFRSLTYIIPGRFRDAEIASESIHSGVQLLSLYHDALLRRRGATSTPTSSSSSPSSAPTHVPVPRSLPSAHARYTRFWTAKSALYRRVAYVLQVVAYTELLCEMAAKRRGERTRWRAVLAIEAVKAACRLLLLRITRSRPVVVPTLPEREPVPELPDDDMVADGDADGSAGEEEGWGAANGYQSADGGAKGHNNNDAINGSATMNGHANASAHLDKDYPGWPPEEKDRTKKSSSPNREWTMPRTGMSLPSLPAAGDISGYLLSRVLTADDIKPATRLLSPLQGTARAAEVLHILAPLIYAAALAHWSLNYKTGNNSTRAGPGTPPKWWWTPWAPWLIGLAAEMAARQLRDRAAQQQGGGGQQAGGLRTTPLEREEWSRRGWAMGWWTMRGAFYDGVTKGVVDGVKRRMPKLLSGILDDYEYLWENYYFSTSS